MSDFTVDLDNLLKKGTENSNPGTVPQSTDNPAQQIDWEKNYKELQSKFGELGEENGKWREFYKNAEPVLTKLADNDQALTQAIMDDKITPDLARAVLDGQIELNLADLVNKAHTQVKTELGKEYKNTPTEDIAKLVEEKTKDLQKDIEGKLEDFTYQQKLSMQIKEFVNNTPDFDDYAEDINKYLDSHKDIKDLEVAYHAVKGMKLGQLSEEDKEKLIINWEKELAANAAGGSSKGTQDANKDPISSYLGL